MSHVIDVLVRRDRPGRSAARHHARIARAWRRRRFGRKTPYVLVVIVTVAILLLPALHLSGRWALLVGIVFGMAVMGVRMLPEALMPGHIFNWQLGAWGEQMTATELAALPKDEWVVRHDVRWGTGDANHDHVLAGPAVYVLNSKYVKDSSVEIEGQNLRVRPLDDPDFGYLADRWVPMVAIEANSLRSELRKALGGFQPHVYPVIVIWGEFDLEPHWIPNVSVGGRDDLEVVIINGHSLVGWLRSQPADLPTPERRKMVAGYVAAMQRA